MRLLALVLVVALLAGGRPEAADGPDPGATLEAVRAARPPLRDLGALRSRIVRPAAAGQSLAAAEPDGFWVLDFNRRVYRSVPVELRRVSEHAEWFVERGRPAGDVAAAAASFEERIFPRVRALTGVEWTPGSNGQPRLAIFNGQVPGVAGYMSNGDTQPRSVFPYSNERLSVYLNVDLATPGSAAYSATLAHELEHLAHSVLNPGQEGWFDEGLAELVANLVMDGPSPPAAGFRGRPDVQLTAWSETPAQAGLHYQASALWARYLMERAGGPAALPELVRAGGRGLETADRFVRQRGVAGGVEEIFRDWLVANAVGNPDLEDGRFGYAGSLQQASVVGTLRPGQGAVEERVHQFAGDYYELSLDGTAELQVALAASVPLIGSDQVRGPIFWSVRGDNLDTRLTRPFDLRGLDRATLRYRVWHDLEPDYDFCYVLGSSDGATWVPLPGRGTTDRDSTGLALGPGYTGRSGAPPAWLEEEIDLSRFAGGPAEVRFECVTDQSYSGPGFALDDLSIPELGFADSGDGDLGWAAEGFVRAPNAMAQPATVLVVEIGDDTVSVRQVPLDADGRGRWPLRGPSAAVQRTLAVVAGLAPLTLEPMSYRLELTAAGP